MLRDLFEVFTLWDLSCETETSWVRWRLVMEGGDFSCDAEICRGDPSCRELVGDAANLSETWRLANVGLDRGPQSSSSWISALTLAILAFTLSTVLGYLVFNGDLFAVKGGPNSGVTPSFKGKTKCKDHVCDRIKLHTRNEIVNTKSMPMNRELLYDYSLKRNINNEFSQRDKMPPQATDWRHAHIELLEITGALFKVLLV
jgi:hypothetical protein